MLVPLQQSSGMFSTDQLRSILEDIEARRQEAEDKAKGTEKDTKLAGVVSDPLSAAAKEKISAYYFGSLKGDPDPMATLISRFASGLGVSQGKDESSLSFARRLSDSLAMLAFDKVDAAGEPVKITLTSLGASEEQVRALLNGTAVGEQNPRAEMAARIAEAAGLTGEEDNFGALMSRALMAKRAGLPENAKALEETTGLKELGLKAQDVIDAILDPWGEAARKVKDALAEKAEREGAMTREMRKVLQRLEDVSDPKTIDELKHEETHSGPGRVEDAETKAERKQDIQNLENAEKLEDVRELQDAVKEHLGAGTDGAKSGSEASVDAELLLIQVIGALPVSGETDGEHHADEDHGEADDISTDVSEADAETENEILALARASKTDDARGLLPIRVDEVGIYELLQRQRVA